MDSSIAACLIFFNYSWLEGEAKVGVCGLGGMVGQSDRELVSKSSSNGNQTFCRVVYLLEKGLRCTMLANWQARHGLLSLVQEFCRWQLGQFGRPSVSCFGTRREHTPQNDRILVFWLFDVIGQGEQRHKKLACRHICCIVVAEGGSSSKVEDCVFSNWNPKVFARYPAAP